MWIDSHCHLTHERTENGDSARAISDRAKQAGIAGKVSICCEISTEFPTLLSTVHDLDNVWCSIGTHPHEAGLEAEKAVDEDRLATLAQSDVKIVGIGESGLDYYYNHSSKDDQQASYRKHIRAAIATGLPLIIHARDADDDIIRILREENGRAGQKVRGVLHCFSSGPALAEQGLEEGLYVSFSGIVTFKKSSALQDIARDVPPDRLLIETDAPFLAPEPLRGRTNEPAYLAHTGAYLARLLEMEESALAALTTKNFFSLFSKAAQTWMAG